MPALTPLAHRGRIDELGVPLKYGMSSRVFHVLPPSSWNGWLAVYHNGHGEPPDMLRTLCGLLERGYLALLCAMPFKHWNEQPIRDPADAAKLVRLGRPCPVGVEELLHSHVLLEPVTVALNYAVAAYKPTSVQMIGLSGGGWTTTVYAAIDPRIIRSYPVAGSLPFYMRKASRQVTSSIGDWEQRRDTLPGFYGIAGYLDLYVMAAAVPSRRQLQVLNRFDPCCFSGVGHRSYGPAVGHRARVIGGGQWEVLENATHDEHTISPYGLELILDDASGHALTAAPRASAGRWAWTGGIPS